MAGVINDPHKGGFFSAGGSAVGSSLDMSSLELNVLNDVILANLADGDVLVYDGDAQVWNNVSYDLRTVGSLTDVDEADKEDGSVLVYQASSSKYETTTRLEQQTIIGGTF